MTLGLHPTASAVAMRWRWRGDVPVQLQMRPQLAMRPVRERALEEHSMCEAIEVFHHAVRVRPRRDLPRVCFAHEGTFVGAPEWSDDLWTPGVVEVVLEPEDKTHVSCALDAFPELGARGILDAAAR
jgi:hypothetical protein